MLSRLQCTFSLNQNDVNDYIKLCVRQYLANLKCINGIMLCPTIILSLATPLHGNAVLLVYAVRQYPDRQACVNL